MKVCWIPGYYFHYEKTLGQFLQCSAWDWDSVIVLLFSFCYNSQEKLMLAEQRSEKNSELTRYCFLQSIYVKWSAVVLYQCQSVSSISLEVLTRIFMNYKYKYLEKVSCLWFIFYDPRTKMLPKNNDLWQKVRNGISFFK